MRITESKGASRLIEEAIAEVVEMGGEALELIDECFDEVALHVVCQFSDERSGMDDLDLWNLQLSTFEAGMRAAELVKPGQRVFAAHAERGGTTWRLWFAATDHRELAGRLKEAFAKYREELRKEKGLLPFKG